MDAALLAAAGGPSANLFGDILKGALPIIGGAIGGPGGAAIGGAVAGALSGGGGAGGESVGGQGSSIPPISSFAGSGACPPGYYSVGGTCINPAAALPGGVPLTLPQPGTSLGGGGGTAVVPSGSMGGVVATAPYTYSTVRRRCPPSMVLGRDNLCYYKGMLPKKMRKWPHTKPYVTRSDYKAIARADRARKKLIRLTKKAGAFASMHKPKPHISKAAAARALRK